MSDWYELLENGSVRKIGDIYSVIDRKGHDALSLKKSFDLKTKVGEAEVSTVFLGLDHSFVSGPPVLFETMIFGGQYDQEMWRYHTKAEAEIGHKAVVQALLDIDAGSFRDISKLDI